MLRDRLKLHSHCDGGQRAVFASTLTKSINELGERKQNQLTRVNHSQQVIFSKKRKKHIHYSRRVCYSSSYNNNVWRIESIQVKSVQLERTQQQNYATIHSLSLGKRLSFALTCALRQLLLLPTTTAATRATSTTTTARETNSNYTATSNNGSGNSYLSSLFSLGHFLRLTLTFSHWTLALAAAFLFILCVNNLIASVSAGQQRSARPSNGIKQNEPSTQSAREFNYYHSHNNRYRPLSTKVRSSPAMIVHRQQQMSQDTGTKVSSKHFVSSIGERSIESKPFIHNGPSLATADLVTSAKRKQLHPPLLLPTTTTPTTTASITTTSTTATAPAAAAITTTTTANSAQTDSLDLSFRQMSASGPSMLPQASTDDSQWIPIVSPSPPPLRNYNQVAPSHYASLNDFSHVQKSALQDHYAPLTLTAVIPPSATNAIVAKNELQLNEFAHKQPQTLLKREHAINRQTMNQGTNRAHYNNNNNNNSNARSNNESLIREHATINSARSLEPLYQASSQREYHSANLPNHYVTQTSSHHHHNRQLDDSYHYHRRPRLNNHYPLGAENDILPPRPSKMYKRVLLCDKTLVSLDYVRNIDSEPRPFGMAHATSVYKPTSVPLFASTTSSEGLLDEVFNDLGDNLIDLDGHFSTISNTYADYYSNNTKVTNNVRHAASAVSSSIDRRNQINPMQTLERSQPGSSNLLTEINSNTAINSTGLSASSSDLSSPIQTADRLSLAESLPAERRNGRGGNRLLSDEDPLVRCDMWDLEKGLKSRKPPAHLLRIAIKTDFDTVRDAINRCRQLSEKTLPPEDEYRDGIEIMSAEDLMSLFSMKRGLIPGTKWCGLGDQANSYNDLGPKHRIDICCRAHDHCPIRSKPFRNDYGVLNIGLYTKSHCDCDADFYRCLREVRSRTADMLGNLYFNVMKLQCMREERLKVCREMKPIALGFERCIRYEDSPIKTVFKFTTPPVAY